MFLVQEASRDPDTTWTRQKRNRVVLPQIYSWSGGPKLVILLSSRNFIFAHLTQRNSYSAESRSVGMQVSHFQAN